MNQQLGVALMTFNFSWGKGPTVIVYRTAHNTYMFLTKVRPAQQGAVTLKHFGEHSQIDATFLNDCHITIFTNRFLLPPFSATAKH